MRYGIVSIGSYKALVGGSTVLVSGSSTVLAIGSARRRIGMRLVNRSIGVSVWCLLVRRAVTMRA